VHDQPPHPDGTDSADDAVTFTLTPDPATEFWRMRPDGSVARVSPPPSDGRAAGALVLSHRTGRPVADDGWQFATHDAGAPVGIDTFLVGLLFDHAGTPQAAAVPLVAGDDERRFFAVGLIKALAGEVFLPGVAADLDALRALADTDVPAVVILAASEPAALPAAARLAGAAPLLVPLMAAAPPQ
jgi:hypothetical protein